MVEAYNPEQKKNFTQRAKEVLWKGTKWGVIIAVTLGISGAILGAL